MATIAVGLLGAGGAVGEAQRKIVRPERGHPFRACTAQELGRLRQAYRGSGMEHDVVAEYGREAERFVAEPVQTGGAPQVTGVGLAATEKGLVTRVESGSHTDTVTILADGRVAVALRP